VIIVDTIVDEVPVNSKYTNNIKQIIYNLIGAFFIFTQKLKKKSKPLYKFNTSVTNGPNVLILSNFIELIYIVYLNNSIYKIYLFIYLICVVK